MTAALVVMFGCFALAALIAITAYLVVAYDERKVRRAEERAARHRHPSSGRHRAPARTGRDQ